MASLMHRLDPKCNEKSPLVGTTGIVVNVIVKVIKYLATKYEI